MSLQFIFYWYENKQSKPGQAAAAQLSRLGEVQIGCRLQGPWTRTFVPFCSSLNQQTKYGMKGHNGSLLANFQAKPSIKMFYGDDSFYFQGYLSHKLHQHSPPDEYGIFTIILHTFQILNTKTLLIKRFLHLHLCFKYSKAWCSHSSFCFLTIKSFQII